jgi:hypothetical protein
MSLKVVYCSQCGTKLPITRKALPKFSTIIDLIDQHICPEEPVELDFKECLATPFVFEGTKKFKVKLDEMNPLNSEPSTIFDKGLQDIRSEVITSMAPQSVLERIKGKVGK